MKIIELNVKLHEGSGIKSFEASVTIPIDPDPLPEKQREQVRRKVEEWLQLLDFAVKLSRP